MGDMQHKLCTNRWIGNAGAWVTLCVVQHKFENKCEQTKYKHTKKTKKKSSPRAILPILFVQEDSPMAFHEVHMPMVTADSTLTAVTVRCHSISSHFSSFRSLVRLFYSFRFVAVIQYMYSSSQFVMAVIVVGFFLFAKFNANCAMVCMRMPVNGVFLFFIVLVLFSSQFNFLRSHSSSIHQVLHRIFANG